MTEHNNPEPLPASPTSVSTPAAATSAPLARPPETSPDTVGRSETDTETIQLPPAPVEIPDEDTVTIPEALDLAAGIGFRIGKSTLQRWAMKWTSLAHASPVRALLVTTRTGNTYRIAKSDFEVWAIEQKANIRTSPNIATGIAAPHPASGNLAPHEPTPVAAPTAPERYVAPEPSAGPDAKDRMIARLESENEFLRGEIHIKNEQLKDATDRSKETNILIHGLQNLVLKLTGQLPAARGEHIDLPHSTP